MLVTERKKSTVKKVKAEDEGTFKKQIILINVSDRKEENSNEESGLKGRSK